MLLCRKIRLQVSEQDAATLEMMQGKCRGLYNWWVMRLRAGERWRCWDAKKTLAQSRKFDPDIDQVYGKLLAEVYFRLDKAMQAFFKRVATGDTPGFPRVRPRHQFFTLCYPAMYVRVKGNTVLLPNCLHKASHLIAGKLVERTVVIGDLSQRQMVTKAHTEHQKALHRAVYNDWGLYQFVQMLEYKCQLAGKELIKLDERDTSKTCSGCNNMQRMPLYQRTYHCGTCGLVMDRDENSAINILRRFLARRGPHTGDPVRCADVFTAIEQS